MALWNHGPLKHGTMGYHVMYDTDKSPRKIHYLPQLFALAKKGDIPQCAHKNRGFSFWRVYLIFDAE